MSCKIQYYWVPIPALPLPSWQGLGMFSTRQCLTYAGGRTNASPQGVQTME